MDNLTIEKLRSMAFEASDEDQSNFLHSVADALLAAQPQASAAQSAHRNLLCELYQVLGALDAPDNVLDNVSAAIHDEPLPHATLLPFVVSAQSAPAGEREAVAYEHWKADMESYGFSGLDAFQAGAAWQRTQSEGVPSVQISGHLDEVDAPVWDFINAEARKLGTITGSIDNYGLSRPNGAQPNGGVAVLWNGQKIHAIAVVVRDAMNRTQCVRVLTAAPAQPAAPDRVSVPVELLGRAALLLQDSISPPDGCSDFDDWTKQGDAIAAELRALLAAAPAQPAAQGEVQSRERWTVMCGHWQDTTLAIHGERTGHIASGIDEDAAHAIVNAHNQGLPPIAAASAGQEV